MESGTLTLSQRQKENKVSSPQFRRLASKIFEPSTSSSVGISLDVDRHHSLRTELFEKLCNYFPEEMTHPRMNLTDLMPYPMD